MREFLSRLLAALREVVRPWPEPERDNTTPEVIAAWVAKHKHPPECAGGCRCKGGRNASLVGVVNRT